MKVELFGRPVTLDPTAFDVSDDELRRQLEEYEQGVRREFDVDVRHPDGFTGDVTRALEGISYGETMSYGEVAREIETSARAVGAACGRNPVPLVVPCHRVTAVDGIGGYSLAGGTDLKLRLLQHEGASHPQR